MPKAITCPTAPFGTTLNTRLEESHCVWPQHVWFIVMNTPTSPWLPQWATCNATTSGLTGAIATSFSFNNPYRKARKSHTNAPSTLTNVTESCPKCTHANSPVQMGPYGSGPCGLHPTSLLCTQHSWYTQQLGLSQVPCPSRWFNRTVVCNSIDEWWQTYHNLGP